MEFGNIMDVYNSSAATDLSGSQKTPPTSSDNNDPITSTFLLTNSKIKIAMKHFLFFIMCAFALVSCSDDDPVTVAGEDPKLSITDYEFPASGGTIDVASTIGMPFRIEFTGAVNADYELTYYNEDDGVEPGIYIKEISTAFYVARMNIQQTEFSLTAKPNTTGKHRDLPIKVRQQQLIIPTSFTQAP